MGVKSKWTQEQIEAFVKRTLNGESVTAVAREAGISRPRFYLWKRRYKLRIIAQSKRQNMTAPDIDTSEKVDLNIENRSLKAEVLRLKEKVFNLMWEAGAI